MTMRFPPLTTELLARAARRYKRVVMTGVLLIGTVVACAARASDYEVIALGPSDSPDVLIIDASTNTAVFRSMLEDFSARHPTIRILYTELPTQTLYDGAVQRAAKRSGPERPAPSPDIIISSSMDLQTKLVNDGYAQPHVTPERAALAPWAVWRNEIFSIGAEAMVMAYNTRLMKPESAPRTRRQLLAMLSAPDRPLMGRIGTYDARSSGIGYMAATQDTRLDSMAGTLLAGFGMNRLRVSASADEILDDLSAGRIALAYNILESYAQRRIAEGAPLAIVRPDDYTLVVSRVALIPKIARRPDLAERFLDYMLSEHGQTVLSEKTGMLSVRPAVQARRAIRNARPVELGVGLLVYLDELKRAHFLRAWSATACPDCDQTSNKSR